MGYIRKQTPEDKIICLGQHSGTSCSSSLLQNPLGGGRGISSWNGWGWGWVEAGSRPWPPARSPGPKPPALQVLVGSLTARAMVTCGLHKSIWLVTTRESLIALSKWTLQSGWRTSIIGVPHARLSRCAAELVQRGQICQPPCQEVIIQRAPAEWYSTATKKKQGKNDSSTWMEGTFQLGVKPKLNWSAQESQSDLITWQQKTVMWAEKPARVSAF